MGVEDGLGHSTTGSAGVAAGATGGGGVEARVARTPFSMSE